VAHQPHRRHGRGAGSGVLAIITEESARRRGEAPDYDTINVMKAMTIRSLKKRAIHITRLPVCGTTAIDPRETRMALTVGLSMCYNRDWVSEGAPKYGNFRM
jgi:hypothetical protein